VKVVCARAAGTEAKAASRTDWVFMLLVSKVMAKLDYSRLLVERTEVI
jgi:hypothetical protein